MKARFSHRGRHNQKSVVLTPRVLFGAFTALVCLLVLVTVSAFYRKLQTSQCNGHDCQHNLIRLNHLSYEELYGSSSAPGSSSANGPSQLLLLSYYNSKSSLVARLLMLMGVFAGDGEQLNIDPVNKLRWWELKQITTLNDLMLRKYAAPGLPSQLAWGFNISKMSPEDLEYYRDRLDGVTRYLHPHQPWLLKDPRLSWLAPLWLEHLDQPLCVLVVSLQPGLLVAQLAEHQAQQGDSMEVGSSAHLERWTNATLSALRACVAVPTIIVPNTVLQPPLLQPFMAVLQQHLKLAGVQGTKLPTHELLQKQYISFLGHDHSSSSSSSSSSGRTTTGGSRGWCGSPAMNATRDGAALLQESCNWLPPAPQGPTSSSSSSSEGELGRLPLPTVALLQALHDYLDTHLAHPEAGVGYTRVAGQLYSSYVARVKELVARQPGHEHSTHHSIAGLIHDALHNVGLEIKALHTALLRQV